MATTYYVKTDGDDGANGLSLANAWKTLTKASNAAAAGSSGNLNTILISPGTYSKQAIKPKSYQEWKRNGDSGVVVIDGGYDSSKEGSAPDSSTFNKGMIDIRNCTGAIVDGGTPYGGIRVQNGGANLIVLVSATNCIIRNIKATFCYKGVLNADRVNGSIVEYCRLEWGNRQEHHGGGQGSGPAGVQVNVLFKRSGTIYFRHNIVCNCHGEGVGWANDSGLGKPWGLRMHNNILFNMSHMHFVANHGHFADVYDNFFFHTNAQEFRQNNSGDPPAGFMISDENGRDADGYKRATYIRAWNNAFVGFSDGLNVRISSKSSSACRNFYFGFNTIANCKTNSNGSTFGMRIPAALSGDPHVNSLIEHNIIINSKSNQCAGAGIAYRRNLFFSSPNGPGGNGNFVADPKLVQNNYVPSGVGDNITWDVNRLKLQSNSPAINAALARQTVNNNTPPTTPYNVDYFGATRNAPDIGFHEFSGTVQNSVTADIVATPTSGQAPLTVNFNSSGSSATGTAEIDSYSWDFDGLGSSSAANPSFEFEDPGTYVVTLTVEDTGLGLSNETSVTIQVTAAPSNDSINASFTRTPPNGFVPLAVTLNASNSSAEGDAVINQYDWDFGDGNSVQGGPAITTHTYTEPGEYTITLTVRDTNLNLSSTTTRMVTAFIVRADFSQSHTSGQEPLEVEFTDLSEGDIDEYLWNFGDGATSTEASPTHIYASGVWTPSLTVRNAAADITSSKTGQQIIVGQDDPGSGGNVVSSRLRQALNTSTGLQNFVFDLGGLVPRFVLFFISGGTAAGTPRDGAVFGAGCATPAGQFAGASYSQHNQPATVSARRWKRGACIVIVDEAGEFTAEAALASLSANTATINITDAPDQAYLVEAVALAGAGVEAYIGEMLLGNQGDTLTIGDPGFAGNVFLMLATAGAEDTPLTSAENILGFAINDANLTQYGLGRRDYHGADPTNPRTMVQNGRSFFSRDGTPNGRASAGLTAFTNSGFSYKVFNDNANMTVPYALLRLDTEIAAGTVTLPTAGDPDPVSLPTFGDDEPQLLLMLLHQSHVLDSQVATNQAGTVGVYIQDGDGAGSVTGSSEDNAATTNTQSLAADNLVIPDDDGGNYVAGSVAFDAAEFAITLTANPAVEIVLPYLVVKSTAAAPPDGPTADLTTDTTSGFLPLTVQFFSTAAGNGLPILSWLWDFGDGTTSTEQHPTHVYADEGNYTVTLTVTTAAGEHTVVYENYILATERVARRIISGPLTQLPVGRRGTPDRVDMDPDSETFGTESHSFDPQTGLLIPILPEAPEADTDYAVLWIDEDTRTLRYILPDETIIVL